MCQGSINEYGNEVNFGLEMESSNICSRNQSFLHQDQNKTCSTELMFLKKVLANQGAQRDQCRVVLMTV